MLCHRLSAPDDDDDEHDDYDDYYYNWCKPPSDGERAQTGTANCS